MSVDSASLRPRIKSVMIDELMLQETPEEIADDASLFGTDGLGLDSVDALQLVVALEKHFGLKIPDAEAAKGILSNVNSIAAAIEAGAAAG
ncbi:MAG: acyl carrier protein [Verrucomicrobiae bacterium]|nr:acyl carrier protein [Verrucomicrobiae bacterium]MCB1092707.1 acyl carrier protein [Verrucomicrobiae bacterium]